MTGASGLLGPPILAALTAEGHEVVCLVRRQPGVGELEWDPEAGVLDPSHLEGCAGVIHLAGEPIGQRWSQRVKQRILNSRVAGTDLLARTLAGLQDPPRVLVCASAIGYYGDRGAEELDEGSAPGSGFLSEVCQAWEAAAEPAQRAGIRIAQVRTGIVLTSLGGALARMLLPFRLGAGGPIAGGRQFMSWISLTDLVRVYLVALTDERLSGPFNAVGPTPVRQREFALTLGRVLHRPAIAPLPAFMVRLLFGEMGQRLILEGCRVLPKTLERSGFTFRHPDLETALRAGLGR